MPKITVHGGPTNAGSGEWPGNSSATSSGSQKTKSEPTENSDLPPVQTTESPSSPDPAESSTAPATDGSGPETPSRNASKAKWAEFARANGFEDEGANADDYTRDQLCAWWEEGE